MLLAAPLSSAQRDSVTACLQPLLCSSWIITCLTSWICFLIDQMSALHAQGVLHQGSMVWEVLDVAWP